MDGPLPRVPADRSGGGDVVERPGARPAHHPGAGGWRDASMTNADPTLLAEAGQALDAAVALRRRIHTRPETGLDLPITQELILDELDGLGLQLATGTATTSV